MGRPPADALIAAILFLAAFACLMVALALGFFFGAAWFFVAMAGFSVMAAVPAALSLAALTRKQRDGE